MGSQDTIQEVPFSDQRQRHDTSTSKDLTNEEISKRFHQRVEEFSMWKDENTFQDMEYKRRREEKKKMKGVIRNDRRLIMSNRLYIPIIGLIFVSVLGLLLSSLEGLGEDTFLWEHSRVFQILGGVCLSLGIIALMAVAAYSYQREDTVREKYGFPSLFASSMKGQTSRTNMEESIMLHNTFVDKPRKYTDRLHRLDSVESRCTGNTLLGQSFSSTSTAMSWVHKHRGYSAAATREAGISLIRRENSDSALDKIFARNRLLSWQMEGAAAAHSPTSGGDVVAIEINTDNSERSPNNTTKGTENTCDSKKQHKGGGVSQIESSVSMASSGYCSNTSTQCLSNNVNNTNENNVTNKDSHRQPLLRHLSEPSHKTTLHYIAKRGRMFSEGIIPDEDTSTFSEQHHPVAVMNIPIINIECV